MPDFTPVLIRHHGLRNVGEAEALTALPDRAHATGVMRNEQVDTAQFAADIDGGNWEPAHEYVWQRAAEIRDLIRGIADPRIFYFGGLAEVPHAVTLGAYFGDEWRVEPFDHHRTTGS